MLSEATSSYAGWGEMIFVCHRLALAGGLLAQHGAVHLVLDGCSCWLTPEAVLMDPDWYRRRRYAAKMSSEEMARRQFEANLAALRSGHPGVLV